MSEPMQTGLGDFQKRFDASLLGIVAGNSFNLSLAYASVGEEDAKPEWFVAIGGFVVSMFTPAETRKFGKRLQKHCRKVGFGHECVEEWVNDLNQVADECEGRNLHGVKPDDIINPN